MHKKCTKAESNYKKNPKMQTRLTNKIPRKIPASFLLTYLDKCGFSTLIAICGHVENALLAVTKVSSFNCQIDKSGTIYFERNCILLLAG